jgi:hypothetical protein
MRAGIQAEFTLNRFGLVPLRHRVQNRQDTIALSLTPAFCPASL